MSDRPGVKERATTVLRVALERAGLQQTSRKRRDMEPEFLEVYDRCSEYTMTSVERMYGLWSAVRYIAGRAIEGDYVECGVWRGGSSMLAAFEFQRQGAHDRRFFLYDTFEGMAEPTAEDGPLARNEWARNRRESHNDWCYSPLEDVRANMLSTGLPADRLELVKGKVEDTIPATVPAQIALLRLDTDWFESTRHELVHLFPLLQPGGVLIVDDYGEWQGARQAVDEYFAEHGTPAFLVRLDETGRVAVKL